MSTETWVVQAPEPDPDRTFPDTFVVVAGPEDAVAETQNRDRAFLIAAAPTLKRACAHAAQHMDDIDALMDDAPPDELARWEETKRLLKEAVASTVAP